MLVQNAGVNVFICAGYSCSRSRQHVAPAQCDSGVDPTAHSFSNMHLSSSHNGSANHSPSSSVSSLSAPSNVHPSVAAATAVGGNSSFATSQVNAVAAAVASQPVLDPRHQRINELMQDGYNKYKQKKYEESVVSYRTAVDSLRELLLEQTTPFLRSQLQNRLEHCEQHAEAIQAKITDKLIRQLPKVNTNKKFGRSLKRRQPHAKLRPRSPSPASVGRKPGGYVTPTSDPGASFADTKLADQKVLKIIAQADQQSALGAKHDADGKTHDAKTCYSTAAELLIQVRRDESLRDKMSKELGEKVKQKITEAVERAEAVVALANKGKTAVSLNDLPEPPLRNPSRDERKSSVGGGSGSRGGARRTGSGGGGRSGGRKLGPNENGSKYTSEELEVLRKSSIVDSRKYLPWMEGEEHNENFSFSKPFEDEDGLLTLSRSQTRKFGGWKRPSELVKNPKMIEKVSPHSVTQTLITDCSFVSSLIISSEYEQKHKKRLITSIIYPQDRYGVPKYNPSGKYMVKLHLNGVARKVLIDDRLPVDRHDQLLCSYSKNPQEFWVSLIEKAFLKVMGGYDFPGSTSCQDLHVLTGWLPERIGVKDSEEFNPNWVFERIGRSLKIGDSLITVATGEDDGDFDRLGLVPTHAYALLRVAQFGDLRLVQLKNPWAHKRWKGAYSDADVKRWTPQLRKHLKFDPERASANDDGLFWIAYKDLLKYFVAIYMNWNPEVLRYTSHLHRHWPETIGPKNDSIFIHENPQFLLDVTVSEKDYGLCWILLNKHIHTSKEEDQDKRDFLTLHVYEEVKTLDHRVYFRGKPMHSGTYINSPQYLVRFELKPGRHKYTIVVSQYQKRHDIYFTLSAHCSDPCMIEPLPVKYLTEESFVSEWGPRTCGGCPNHKTYPQNPQFRLQVKQKTSILMLLLAPKEFSINIILIREDAPRIIGRTFAESQVICDSGAYRSGFTFSEARDVEPGNHIVLLSTFDPGKKAAFRFTVKLTKPNSVLINEIPIDINKQ